MYYISDIKRLPVAEKNAWVKALRSGKYIQAYGSLGGFDRGGNCCLGVLCEVENVSYDPRDALLPVEYQDHFKYLGEDCIFLVSTPAGTNVCITLPKLNDAWRFSFDQIADIIDYFL